ncbi:MAG: hypothetical protein EPN21_14140 [Methylococcaceae bacterium]|nr:MAG: hypothetical protein EPN21_14140 [Methylococcaceae bacterium]
MVEHQDWLSKTSNYGELILPPLPISLGELRVDPASADPTLTEPKGRWLLVQVAPQGRCETACRAGLHQGKQVWLRLSKDLPRVRRLLITTELPLDAAAAQAVREGDDTLIIAKASSNQQKILEAQALTVGAGATLWLLDPLGNLMMRYPLDYDPHGLLRDLQRLLKASQAG